MSKYLTPTAAALYLAVSEKTLMKLRRATTGPEYTRDTQGHVQYTKEALDAWRAKHRRTIRYIPLEASDHFDRTVKEQRGEFYRV